MHSIVVLKSSHPVSASKQGFNEFFQNRVKKIIRKIDTTAHPNSVLMLIKVFPAAFFELAGVFVDEYQQITAAT